MSVVSLLSTLVLYPLYLLGDGCILIAIALAATVGGRPILWGASFATFHALYGIIGLVVATEISDYSEKLGDVFVLIGAYILLRHFMHHRLHHMAGGDCSCENHQVMRVSTGAVISMASALSIHNFASSAILRRMTGEESTTTLAILLLVVSLVVGALISTIVIIGDKERTQILRALDKLPGIVTTILASICCLTLYHLVTDIIEIPFAAKILFFAAGTVGSIAAGYKVHARITTSPATQQLTTISSKRARHD